MRHGVVTHGAHGGEWCGSLGMVGRDNAGLGPVCLGRQCKVRCGSVWLRWVSRGRRGEACCGEVGFAWCGSLRLGSLGQVQVALLVPARHGLARQAI